MKNIRNFVVFHVITVVLLIGCERENGFPDLENNNLKAIAGEAQEAFTNEQVGLNGSATGASAPISFLWSFKSKPAGSLAIIEDVNKDTTNFKPDIPGIYVLELKVTKDEISDIDEIVITALLSQPGPILISQNILTDLVLQDVYDDPSIADYLVTADLVVNALLTIEPGVTVKFEANTGLMIFPNGALIGKGTVSDRIIFTGKEALKGYWKGILFSSNNPLNELENASVSYGGGNSFQDEPGIRANVILSGSDFPGSAVKISASTFTHSSEYGLYLKGLSQLNAFHNNSFSDNNAASAFIHPGQLHMLDFNSHFTGNNGYNGIETGGILQRDAAVIWPAFNDGSKYLVTSDLILRTGLKITEGATLEIKAGMMIEVSETGFLDATGTETSPVTFTAQSKTVNGHWKGILFKSQDELNILTYADVSFAGILNLPGITNKSNIAVAPAGSLIVRSSKIHDGLGYGIVADAAYQVNSDIFASNAFYNLAEGIILPYILRYPDAPSLEGAWVDWWSFTNARLTVDSTYYNRATNAWFHGAPDPWQMPPPAGGFGLKLSANGNYIWSIAEKHVDPQCFSYSAEYITGYQTYTPTQIYFTEEFWRSKFVRCCTPEQNVDINITPGTMILRYEINKLHNDLTGEDYWELKLINPDKTSFSYYRPLSKKD